MVELSDIPLYLYVPHLHPFICRWTPFLVKWSAMMAMLRFYQSSIYSSYFWQRIWFSFREPSLSILSCTSQHPSPEEHMWPRPIGIAYFIPLVRCLILELSGSSYGNSSPGSGAQRKAEERKSDGDFPGGAVVKNPPANAGDTGSSPGPGRSHVPWSN